MTTLAWDGREMAADSQSTLNGSIPNGVIKIFKEEDYILAFCGSIDEGYMFKAVMADELKAKDCRFTKDFSAMVWTSDGEMTEWYDSIIPVPVCDKYVAMGSGAGAALAAMYAGKTAREAVEIAKKVDVFTGGKVISYSWDVIKKKGKKKKNDESLSKCYLQEPLREVSGTAESTGGLGGDSSPVHGVPSKASRQKRVFTFD